MRDKAGTVIRSTIATTNGKALETEGTEKAKAQMGPCPVEGRRVSRLCRPEDQNEKLE